MTPEELRELDRQVAIHEGLHPVLRHYEFDPECGGQEVFHRFENAPEPADHNWRGYEVDWCVWDYARWVVMDAYSTDWSATGPLLEKYGLSLFDRWTAGRDAPANIRWSSWSKQCSPVWGETPLIAICQAVLAIPLQEGRE